MIDFDTFRERLNGDYETTLASDSKSMTSLKSKLVISNDRVNWSIRFYVEGPKTKLATGNLSAATRSYWEAVYS